MGYLVISPCRDEADYLQRTLDSMAAQTVRPDLWLIVDDGSTDATPQMLAAFAAEHDWVKVVEKPNRGHRAVGPGVIEAFYFGYDQINPDDFEFVTKLDLDLDLPPKYFEILIQRMNDNPRIGTCSGKAYFKGEDGKMHSERCGDETSLGMTKFYRTKCFQDIGGFVREVMWDGIDCHTCRQKGWIAVSWDEPDLRFEHLRPMGSSQKNIFTGRARHGFGQWFMGSHPLYFMASAVFRMRSKPYIVGGLSMMYGYFRSMLKGERQLEDKDLIKFIRAWQMRALTAGKAKATEELNERGAAIFAERFGSTS